MKANSVIWNNKTFKEGDIIEINDSHLNGHEFRIIKLLDDGYAGRCDFEFVNNPPSGYSFWKNDNGLIILEYGLSILSHATKIRDGIPTIPNTMPSPIPKKKPGFTLKVGYIANMTNHLDQQDIQELLMDGYTLSITAWINGHMYDDHVTEQFPQLQNLGLEELAEGDMYYMGNMSQSDMIRSLKKLGFKVLPLI